eukprot:6190443-Pleurochrysis_carterae.AAC.1
MPGSRSCSSARQVGGWVGWRVSGKVHTYTQDGRRFSVGRGDWDESLTAEIEHARIVHGRTNG